MAINSQKQQNTINLSQNQLSQDVALQITLSNEEGLSQIEGIANYVFYDGLTPEEFYRQSQESQSTLSASSQQLLQDLNGSNEKSSLGNIFQVSSSSHLQSNSPHSLPSLGLSVLHSNETSKELQLDTPAASQEHAQENKKSVSPVILTQHTKNLNKCSKFDDEAELFTDSNETDEILASDNDEEQENQRNNSLMISKTFPPNFNNDAMDLSSKQQMPSFYQTKSKIYSKVNEHQINLLTSIGKSNEVINRLEAGTGSYSQFGQLIDHNGHVMVNRISETRSNGPCKLINQLHNEPFQEQSPMEICHNGNVYVPNKNVYGKNLHDFNLVNEELQQNQSLGLKQGGLKNYGKLKTGNYRSSANEFSESRSSSPTSTTTTSEDWFNDDSNDSIIRKRKAENKKIVKVTKILNNDMKESAEIQSQKEIKGLSQQMKDTTIDVNSANSMMDSRGKRFLSSYSSSPFTQSANSSSYENSFDFFSGVNAFFHGDSDFNPLSLDKSTTNSSISNLSRHPLQSDKSTNSSINNFHNDSQRSQENESQMTKIHDKLLSDFNKRDMSLDLSTSMNVSNLNSFAESIDTPINNTSMKASQYGPIYKETTKSSTKKSQRVRKSSNTSGNLLNNKKVPSQKRLNISESQVTSTNQATQQSKSLSSTTGRSKNSSAKKANEKTVANNAKPKLMRSRNLSVSSSKSVASEPFTEDDDEEDFEQANESAPVNKDKKRRQNNNMAARKYRQKIKIEEQELNEKIMNLQSNYLKMKKELRDLLVRKHTFIKALIENERPNLPEWAKNDPVLLI